jgi:hypothetical protein
MTFVVALTGLPNGGYVANDVRVGTYDAQSQFVPWLAPRWALSARLASLARELLAPRRRAGPICAGPSPRPTEERLVGAACVETLGHRAREFPDANRLRPTHPASVAATTYSERKHTCP